MNNEQSELGIIDKLTIISFLAQIENMEEDARQTAWIHKVIMALSTEIEKLHRENDILIEKVDKILKIIGG